jgi:hypothetical protein
LVAKIGVEQLASQQFGSVKLGQKFDDLLYWPPDFLLFFLNVRKEFRIRAKKDAPPRHDGI